MLHRAPRQGSLLVTHPGLGESPQVALSDKKVEHSSCDDDRGEEEGREDSLGELWHDKEEEEGSHVVGLCNQRKHT